MTDKDWYTNKDLYEMQVKLSKRMEGLSGELATTQTMIRDYNGLRERLDKCEQRLDEGTGQKRGSKDMWGYVVGGIGLISLIVSMIANY